MERVNEKIFSVSEFITLLNIGLNKSQVKMIGEVSEAKVNSSGHVYFVLKDKKDGRVDIVNGLMDNDLVVVKGNKELQEGSVVDIWRQ